MSLLEHGYMIVFTGMSSMCPKTSMCEVPSGVLWRLRADVVYDNGVVEIYM